MLQTNKQISEEDLQALITAKILLENPGFIAKVSNFIGGPIEKSFNLLPKNWSKKLSEITNTSLLKAADIAIFSMKDNPGKKSLDSVHKWSLTASGAIGGFFGFAGLAIELPVSTTIMLRSIIEISRAHGESLANPETKLACLEVFAFGGNTQTDDGTETGYFATRTFLSKSMTKAANYITEKGIIDEGAPIILRLITKIAQRFGIQITEKVAAQTIPLIGAAGGAIINTMFMDHFQDMAKGHFTIRKLERKYGHENIKKTYEKISL